MTCATLTDIVILLDRSGSMESVQAATIEAFNGYVHSQRSGDGFVNLSLIQFDDRYEPMFTALAINAVRDLTTDTYQPRGGTALYDAIGRSIFETGQRYSQMQEKARPGKVLFVIQTDGLENASKRFQLSQINDLIAEHRDKYNWQFVFLGANQDAIASAAQVGIPATASLTYGGDRSGTLAAFAILGERTAKFRGSTEGVVTAATFQFDENDRKRAKK